jgi:DNA invertase Pin-like site-specific DNA recombinase
MRSVHIIESDLIRMRTREGMKVAKAKGRLCGKQPKLKPAQEAHLVELWRAGQHTSAELAELFPSPAQPSTGPSAALGTSTSTAPPMSS